MTVLEAYRRLDRRFMAVTSPWIYLLVPGIALHELCHAAVGRRWAAVSVDWTVPQVQLHWGDDVPVYALFATFLSPLWAGGVSALALALVVDGLPDVAVVWLGLNWFLLAGPSVVDVVSLWRGLRA